MSGKARELLATDSKVAENAEVSQFRTSRWSELIVVNKTLDQLAREGALFSIRNATQGTGVAQTANTTSDTTKPFITMTNPSTSDRVITLHKLWMKPTAVSMSQTIQVIDVVTCDGTAYASAGTDYGSAASNIATAGYLNHAQGQAPATKLSVIRVGVPVTVLGTLPRNMARFTPRPLTIPVAQDQYTMTFGDKFNGAQHTVVEPVSTTVNHYVRQFASVVLYPNSSVLIIPWATSVAGAMSWEFELIWSET